MKSAAEATSQDVPVSMLATSELSTIAAASAFARERLKKGAPSHDGSLLHLTAGLAARFQPDSKSTPIPRRTHPSTIAAAARECGKYLDLAFHVGDEPLRETRLRPSHRRQDADVMRDRWAKRPHHDPADQFVNDARAVRQ
jgi:hypothetical protein